MFYRGIFSKFSNGANDSNPITRFEIRILNLPRRGVCNGSSEVLRLNPTQIEINCADFDDTKETELPGGDADKESGGCSSIQGSSLFSVLLLSILGIAFRRKKRH